MTDTFRNVRFGNDGSLFFFSPLFLKKYFLKKKLTLKIDGTASTGKNWNYMNMLASLGRWWWQHRQCVTADISGCTQNYLHNQHYFMSVRTYKFPSNVQKTVSDQNRIFHYN
jgi:hypothetical protein